MTKKLNKIRVGLMLNNYEIPTWAYLMLKEIITSDYADICLVVFDNSIDTQHKKNGNIINKIIRNRNNLFYFGYRMFEKIRHLPKYDLFEVKNCKDLLCNSDEISVTPIKKKFSDTINDDDVKKIKEHDLDVMIRLGFRILKGEILNSAKFGIWSYHNADNKINHGGPPGFWEVFENIPYTGIVLQELTEDLDSGNIISTSFTSTDSLSVIQNLNNLYWKNIMMIPRKLKELQRFGRDDFLMNMKKYNSDLNFYDHKLYIQPTNIESICMMSKQIQKYLKTNFFKKRYSENRSLLFDFRDGPSQSLWRFKQILSPKGSYFSNPFIVEKENKYFIFITEFLTELNKSRISLITMNVERQYSKPFPIIEKSYSVSCPNIFEFDGTYFLALESSKNKSIDIYKCKNFPFNWEFLTSIMTSVKSVDNTLFYKNNMWWLFSSTGILDSPSNDELSIFYSKNPLNPNWTPHPRNPVVTDVRNARSGGKIFEYCGNIYRPSQDCAGCFGKGLNFNKIDELNEFQFKEISVSSVHPNWNKKVIRINSFAWKNKLSIFDVCLTSNL